MTRLVALVASVLALTVAAPVSGGLHLHTNDAVEDLDVYGLRGPPLRRLLQRALLAIVPIGVLV